MDIDGRWVSGDAGSRINWEWDTVNVENRNDRKPSLQRWQIRRENEALLSEINDRAEWGILHFTGPAVSISTYRLLILLILTLNIECSL